MTVPSDGSPNCTTDRPTAALAGRVVLVTGGGGGVGHAACLALATERARLVVNDLGCEIDGTCTDPRVAERVCEEIVRRGGEAVASQHDVSTVEGAQAAVDLATRSFGRLDALVTCTGVLQERSLVRLDDDVWERAVRAELKAAYLCSRAAAQQMIDQADGGSIVCCAGAEGVLSGEFGQAHLAAANAGVVGMSRALAVELRHKRIRVNTLLPFALTRMTAAMSAFQGVSGEALGPEHVAPVIVFLLSDLSKSITGQTISVTGAKISLARTVETAGAIASDEAWTADSVARRWGEIAK